MLSRRTQQEVAGITAENLFEREYVDEHPASLDHHNNATAVFPNGVTHDGRYVEPFNLTVTHAKGAYKWDEDGNRYIDFVTGHGALILGHNHPAVIEAVKEQLDKGTHLGANHPLELAWAEKIVEIVPGAEAVRFTSSGTEAIMMAVRLARNFTGRTTLVQFTGHFHGWSDIAFGGAGGAGLPAALQSLATVIPCGDRAALDDALADELAAAVILETSHPGFFALSDPAGYLAYLREATARTGTLLITDEVVSGFRWAPGGAQEFYGTHGDLTTLAKILAGGLPGGAVTGRADIINTISFDPLAREGRPKVLHPGTYNGNPLSAAAGNACLGIVRDPAIQRQANQTAVNIRSGMNTILNDLDVPGSIYGASSAFRIALGGDEVPPASDLVRPVPGAPSGREGTSGSIAKALQLGMLNGGVALMGTRGSTSIAHSADDVDQTLSVFTETVEQIRDTGVFE